MTVVSYPEAIDSNVLLERLDDCAALRSSRTLPVAKVRGA